MKTEFIYSKHYFPVTILKRSSEGKGCSLTITPGKQTLEIFQKLTYCFLEKFSAKQLCNKESSLSKESKLSAVLAAMFRIAHNQVQPKSSIKGQKPLHGNTPWFCSFQNFSSPLLWCFPQCTGHWAFNVPAQFCPSITPHFGLFPIHYIPAGPAGSKPSLG